ncbi:MAG: FAD-dependent oxidoreductase [Candidatus Latescibacteria bacterium]|nr:FAD-dependent oxidoreductase [Candidatus Latescibacterota bacterium]
MAQVVIIGGGVAGVCSAHYLLEAGHQVTLVERDEICAGSSYGNAGLIVPSHSVPLAAPGMIAKGVKWMFRPDSPFYIKPRLDGALLHWLWRFYRASRPDRMQRGLAVIRDLSLASRHLYDDLARLDGVYFDFAARGNLTVANTPAGLAGLVHEAQILQAAGVDAEVVGPKRMAELEAAVQIKALGGVYFAQDAHLSPDRFVRGLGAHVQARGGTIVSGQEVSGFVAQGRRIRGLQTVDGTQIPVADQVVLAGGSWSPGLAKMVQVDLPIQPAKGYSITCRQPPACPTTPIMLAEAKVGITPMGERLRLAGTLELAGMDFSINARRVEAIRRSVPQYLPQLQGLDEIEVWRGLRPCTPDGLPFLGRARTWDNLTVAAGHAMIGISLGPITGRLVAQVVAGLDTEIPIEALRLDRF